MKTVEVHVTKVTRDNVYGHSTDHCDPAGCAGDELFWADLFPDECEPGDVKEVEVD